MTLQPEKAFLELLAPVFREHCEIFELAPETTWRVRDGRFVPNGYDTAFRRILDQTGCPAIGHGVALSIGTASPGDDARFERWLAAIDDTHARFQFSWYSDHLAATQLDESFVAIPLALAHDAETVSRVRRRLDQLQTVVPRVALETAAHVLSLSNLEDEPAFTAAAIGPHGLVLDLHNVHVMAQNFGLDAWRFITDLPLEQVIEIHLSGGRDSDPAWLPSRRVQRLDSHDDLVPEVVWSLFERVLPLCPALDAVILERMEGTVTAADVAPIAAELLRARELVSARRLAAPRPPTTERAFPSGDPATFQSALEAALRSRDPAAFATVAHPHLRPDDLRLTALHVARLRSERLLQGSPDAVSWFELAPADFAAAFRAYHLEVPPTGFLPSEEARSFERALSSVRADNSQ